MRLSLFFLPLCLHYRADDFLPFRENQPWFFSFRILLFIYFFFFPIHFFSSLLLSIKWGHDDLCIYTSKNLLFRECPVGQMGKVDARLSWRGDPVGMWNWPFMGFFLRATGCCSHGGVSLFNVWLSYADLSLTFLSACLFCVPFLFFFLPITMFGCVFHRVYDVFRPCLDAAEWVEEEKKNWGKD